MLVQQTVEQNSQKVVNIKAISVGNVFLEYACIRIRKNFVLFQINTNQL